MVRYSKKQIIISFLVICLVVIGINYFKPNEEEHICDYYQKIYNKGLEGVIEKKFLDKDNHYYPTLLYRNNFGKLEELILVFDNSRLFDNTRVGDNIQKDSASILVTVNDNIFYLDYGVDCID